MPYVKVNCTSCGGEIQLDSSKDTGYCLHCGTKVIFEEAIQKIELLNIPKTENLIKIARAAYEDKNYSEAIDYFNRVLEIDIENWEAVFYKGLSKAWQSTLSNNCLPDAINGSKRALAMIYQKGVLSKEELEKTKIKFAIETNDIIISFFNLAKSHYEKYWNLENSAPEYWCYLEYCIQASEHCITLLSAIQTNAKITLLKNVINLLVEKCKNQMYVAGHNEYGDIRKFVSLGDSERQQAVLKYDKYVFEIRKYDPSYQAPKINRSNNGCYIATAIYGSYDAVQVIVLRRYRDDVLLKSFFGRVFVRLYYWISPFFVKTFVRDSRINYLSKVLLDKITEKIEEEVNLVN